MSLMSEKLVFLQVEVGSLEEVIVRMEADSSGEWSSVMFVPAGQLGNKRDS